MIFLNAKSLHSSVHPSVFSTSPLSLSLTAAAAMANHHATNAIDRMSTCDTRKTYDVFFLGGNILTTVTQDPAVAADWISQIESFNLRSLRQLIVGLDVEWRPSYTRLTRNPVATLQLCVGRRCLIYQLIHSPYVPKSLVDFLANPNYTFVGVGVKEDVEKLQEDYEFGLHTNVVELGGLAAGKYGRRELNKAGLKGLARVVVVIPHTKIIRPMSNLYMQGKPHI